MWFVQIICAPFKAVVLLYKLVRLVIIGCKIAAPHVSAGIDKANESLELFNQNLQKRLDDQTRSNEAEEARINRHRHQLALSVQIRELEKKLTHNRPITKVGKSSAEILEDLRKEREVGWEELRKQIKANGDK